MKIKSKIVGMTLYALLATASVIASNADVPAIIPQPQKMELRAGAFHLTSSAKIFADAASRQTANQLAERLRPSTGYSFKVHRKLWANAAVPNAILLTTKNADTNLGPEGYELTVSTNSVVIRAPTQAGLFYGVQTLLQLLPPQVFSSNVVAKADWRMPSVQIRDWPRFKWRGLMLDVARHFYSKPQVERLLDLMALQKMNVFHWHLVDDDGWRIEIKKYPKLTQIGAWRAGIDFGLNPKDSTAYGSDGRYGGFYTEKDIREVVAYAAARHITIVPEIEMPGHSGAALAAYPQFGCTDIPASLPHNAYSPANPQTFQFLENVLMEVFQLFPGKYVHIGGDEVPMEAWAGSPACQALMKRKGLKNTKELQSWFVKRIAEFVSAHGKVPIGWSEIMKGGLASNAVVMDWIGGGKEAATEGHDVVMASHQYCYFCYYPSLDRTPELTAPRPCLPLKTVYAFNPIPANLKTASRSHILGVEGCLWTPNFASMYELEELCFPRSCALAEVAWSSKSSRNFDNFSRRLAIHLHRLDQKGVVYWKDDAIEIGGWEPGQITASTNLLEWDVPSRKLAPGKYRLSMDYTRGKNSLRIHWAALMENGRKVACDTHEGLAGAGLELFSRSADGEIRREIYRSCFRVWRRWH
jgi:hexosaminidase